MRSSTTLLLLCLSLMLSSSCCRRLGETSNPSNGYTLESVRDSLTRQEDTIVFCLIERARYPYNSPAYDPSYLGSTAPCGGRSLVEFFVRETEALHAKVGRYQNPEELPYFPHDLPLSLVPPYNYTQVLYPAAASVNVSSTIWDIYFHKLLPLFTAKGDDGNYGLAAASDLVCLQALSRRIHFGRFVAEVKFRDAPKDYIPAIRDEDRDALTKLVTSPSVEETVKERVKKKAMVFGQNVTLENKGNKANTDSNNTKYKVDPSVVYGLYANWVIPLTKLVEVEYLLRRLD